VADRNGSARCRPRRSRLAAAGRTRQKTHPAQALPVYWRLIDGVLNTADRRAYAAALRLLMRARDAAAAAEETDAFEASVSYTQKLWRRRDKPAWRRR
jgi:hypothetical protein